MKNEEYTHDYEYTELFEEMLEYIRQQARYQQEMIGLLKDLNGYVEDDDSKDVEEQDNRSREELLAALEKVCEEKDGWEFESRKLEKQQGALMEEYMQLRSHFLSVSNKLQAVTKERDDLRTRLQQFNLRLPQIDVDE